MSFEIPTLIHRPKISLQNLPFPAVSDFSQLAPLFNLVLSTMSHTFVYTRAGPISCMLLHHVMIPNEWFTHNIWFYPELLFKIWPYLIQICLSYCHYYFYFSLQSHHLKILFVFCQAVILNKDIGLKSPAWLSSKWFIDSRGPIKIRQTD